MGEGTDTPRSWASAHSLASYGEPRDCHGTCGRVTQLASLLEHTEAQGPVEASCLPSWTKLVLTSLCSVLNGCHSFRACALSLSCLRGSVTHQHHPGTHHHPLLHGSSAPMLLPLQPVLHAVSSSVQFSSVAQSCPTLCDPMNRSTPGLPVHHKLPEFTQTHVH